MPNKLLLLQVQVGGRAKGRSSAGIRRPLQRPEALVGRQIVIVNKS